MYNILELFFPDMNIMDSIRVNTPLRGESGRRRRGRYFDLERVTDDIQVYNRLNDIYTHT